MNGCVDEQNQMSRKVSVSHICLRCTPNVAFNILLVHRNTFIFVLAPQIDNALCCDFATGWRTPMGMKIQINIMNIRK